MKIATLLFTYNRSNHTQQVLEGLNKNNVLPQKLFVFQDGLREDTDRVEWEKVKILIDNIDWCKKETIISKTNQGLAASIVSGINYVFKEYDGVIVLEDDCVPTRNFIDFMNQCLYKYKNDTRIYSISGYSWPIKLAQQQYDVYGCGRVSSWGWGTWKNRWDTYKKDYELAWKMKQEAEASRNLAMWGSDLEDMLVGNIRGTCDSWAVFWALNVIERNGVCINPYRSFIKNIGMDGSGVHCGVEDQSYVEYIDEKRREFHLPDTVDLLDETKMAFSSLYGSYTALNNSVSNRTIALIYGVGNFYKINEKQINDEYYIKMFIDINKKGYFAGKKIIKPDEINGHIFEKIIIMIQDEIESLRIADSIMKTYNIPEEKIEFGFLKYGFRGSFKQ